MAVRWFFSEERPDPEALRLLHEEAGVSGLAARVLWARRIRDPASARAFLQPRLDALLDPGGLLGMDRAVERIAQAVGKSEPIWIYGDYDVDGSSATALLVNFFRVAGVPVRAYIPHRISEGYGLNCEALASIAREGARVVVTVDNGISAFAEARAARSLGIDLIITDHHEPHAGLLEAFAVINPKQEGCGYADKDLAGVGLAFKLAWALAQRFSRSRKVRPELREFLMDALAFVALGTVADMAPLVGENRILVSFGLSALSRSRHPGLRALREVCAVKDRVGVREVGFGLGPRINAGGRIGQPDLGMKLLTTTSEEEAVQIADLLNQQNKERQKIERQITESALGFVAKSGADRWSHVLADESWHAGVVGIVASRIVDRYHRPAIVIAWEPDGAGKGSGRSIRNFHLVKALEECKGELTQFGGHAHAAGVRLRKDRFQAFSDRFEEVARSRLTPQDLVPALAIDVDADFAEITQASARELVRMGPFGIANPRPVLRTRGVQAVGTRRKLWGTQCQVYLRQNGTVHPAVASEAVLEELPNAQAVEVAYTVREGYRNRSEVELELRAVRPAQTEGT